MIMPEVKVVSFSSSEFIAFGGPEGVQPSGGGEDI